jgi:hypothetical protein
VVDRFDEVSSPFESSAEVGQCGGLAFGPPADVGDGDRFGHVPDATVPLSGAESRVTDAVVQHRPYVGFAPRPGGLEYGRRGLESSRPAAVAVEEPA